MNGHIRKRINKTGVTWQIIIEQGFDEEGNRKRTCKTVQGTKKEAQKIMTKMLNELNTGLYIEPVKITLSKYLKDWLETYVKPNLSPTTVGGYKTNIERHIIPNIGHIPIQQLQPVQIKKMYDKLSSTKAGNNKEGLSAKSIRYIHVNLREALQHAFKMQLIERNPADFVTIPKVKKYHAEVYDEQEVVGLLQKAKGSILEVPICLAVGVGLRRGEILGLKWQSIDFDNKRLKVESNLIYAEKELIFHEPKTESGLRTVSIPDEIIEILKKHRIKQKEYKLMFGTEYKNMDIVCCNEDGSPIIPGNLSHRFARFLKRNKLKHIRFHDLRHTNASLMLKYGVPAKVASSRLGHSGIGITLDLYSHIYTEVENEAANKINSGIFGKVVQNK